MAHPRRRKLGLLRRLLSARGRTLEIAKSGWLFIGLTLAVGFAAINTGSNLLHALFGAQMALIIGSGIYSEGTVRRASARRHPVGPIYAGVPAAVEVHLRNTDRRTDLLSASVEDDDRVETDGRCAPVFAVRIGPGESITLSTTVTFSQRGRRRMPEAVVATRFPFGLFVKRRELAEPPKVLVYPRLHPIGPEAVLAARHLGEGEAGDRVARTGEFHSLRDYREGDDPRRLHWPAIARLARPVVREHVARGSDELTLELAAGKTGEPSFERAVEDIASIAVAQLRAAGVAVGLRYGGDLVLPPASGRGQRHRILEFLATVGGVA